MRRLLLATACLSLPAGVLAATPKVQVSADIHHDVSPALRDLPAAVLRQPPQALPAMPWRRIYAATIGPRPFLGAIPYDPALQSGAGSRLAAIPGLNVLGVGTGFTGPQGTYTVESTPPDTTGAAGDTQVVEWVNTSYAVFDKATGNVLAGPIPGNALWAGFGGGCESNNSGDPIVVFDRLADRWVLTQFAVEKKPYLECVAVSQSADATGPYYRYAFSQPGFNDYPKLGVWPDAYYITYVMFGDNGDGDAATGVDSAALAYTGPRACAMDRASMLAGAAATQECFDLGHRASAVLPADLDGPTPPPVGEPNPVVGFGVNALLLWSFHADFKDSSQAQLAGPVALKVAPFVEACDASNGTCIPQRHVAQKLDSLGDRPMFRLAYRNYAQANPPHESLVFTHSIETPNSASGLRWYELRSPGSSPYVFQEGTYSPDRASRWMGSIAMDKAGDMLLGYSASGVGIAPELRITGRLATDTPGAMEGEKILYRGGGVQVGVSRWGDYSAMTIDPVDDCTFWYFNEYIPAGTAGWATRAVSAKFPECR